jgi:L-seryl-tRNA(Ser) seleniumtransferase
MSIYDRLGVPTVVNAAGPLTRLGGGKLSDEVLEAMRSASRHNVRIEDLQARAGEVVARHTGAEAGYVTGGAAAGLTLAAAACLAGLDLARMDRLPDTEGMPNEILVQRPHHTAYLHALRVSGAKLVDVGYAGHPGAGCVHAWQLEQAITASTVAIAYSVMRAPGALSLPEVAAIAHRNGLPVLVDAAAALPPAENLRRFIAEGADLVTFSGGKAIGGPQASGILAGRADLIRSVALQQQDMDVRPDTWTLRHELLGSGLLPGPPHHGLGRSMKVGKEEIAGLVVALEAFVRRDHAADQRRWQAQLDALARALEGVPGLCCRILRPEETPRPYPFLLIDVAPAAFGHTAVDVINLLQQATPLVCLAQGFVDEGAVAVIPTQLDDGDELVIAERLAALARAEGRG